MVQWINKLLQSPDRVFFYCALFVLGGLLVDGTLFKLWSLHREKNSLELKLTQMKEEARKAQIKIRQANDPRFIEREARDRFDLVQENDLVFVFSD